MCNKERRSSPISDELLIPSIIAIYHRNYQHKSGDKAFIEELKENSKLPVVGSFNYLKVGDMVESMNRNNH